MPPFCNTKAQIRTARHCTEGKRGKLDPPLTKPHLSLMSCDGLRSPVTQQRIAVQASGDRIPLAEVRKALQGPNGRNAESITFGDFEEIMSQQQQSAGVEEDAAGTSKDRPYPLGTQLQVVTPCLTAVLATVGMIHGLASDGR